MIDKLPAGKFLHLPLMPECRIIFRKLAQNCKRLKSNAMRLAFGMALYLRTLNLYKFIIPY